MGFNTLESLYNARFDPDKCIVTVVAVGRDGYPPDACEGDIRGCSMSEKLQKVLARAGHGSRREIETMIEAGRVSVDGKVAKLGDRKSVV